MYQWATWPLVVTAVWLKLKSPELVDSNTPSWFKEFTKCTHNSKSFNSGTNLKNWKEQKKMWFGSMFLLFPRGYSQFSRVYPSPGGWVSHIFSGRISKWLAFVWPPRWWNQMHQIIGITQRVFKRVKQGKHMMKHETQQHQTTNDETSRYFTSLGLRQRKHQIKSWMV